MSNSNNDGRQGQNLDHCLNPVSNAADSEADFLPKHDWSRFMPALFLLLVTLALIWRAVDTLQWPTVTGTVERTWISSVGRGATHFNIQYSYSVGNKSYSHASPWAQVYAESGDYSEKFPPGTELPVRYNRQNPADAVLHPGEDVIEIVWIPGLFFFVALIPALYRKTYYQTPPVDDFDRGLQTVISAQGNLRDRTAMADSGSESRRLEDSERNLSNPEEVRTRTPLSQHLHSPLLDDDEINYR